MSWDEARELLAIVLVVSAVLIVAAPFIRYQVLESRFGFWDTLSVLLANVGPVPGGLLLGAAVAVCTVQPADVVPALRRTVEYASLAVAAAGAVAILIELTSASANENAAFFIRLSALAQRSIPGMLLAGLAAWLVRRVVPFPK